MRLKKSIFNALSNSGILFIRSIFMLIVRIVLIRTLGSIYLGVDSLFNNILVVLSIFDLGINNAICYNLYEPLNNKNYKKVSILMKFYKKIYYILGTVVAILGLCLLPFVGVLTNHAVDNIIIIYLLYLLMTVVPYFVSYKELLLLADQNLYKTTKITLFSYIILYTIDLVILLNIPNLILYVLNHLIILSIQKILISRYATKYYKKVNFNIKEELNKKEQKDIIVKTKSSFITRLGAYLVNGADNIIISITPNLGIGIVGIYTNYYSLTNMTDSFVVSGLNGIKSSFGNLAVNESEQTQENVFKIINFASFVIYGLFSIGFIFLLTPFISFCFGSSYTLEHYNLYLIALNFYMMGKIRTLDVAKEATGNYIKDKYANIIQAIINIILSLILGYKFGFIGIILATTISYILVPLWNKPYITYKYTFKTSPKKYIIGEIKNFISLLLIFIVEFLIINKINITNNLISFFIKGIVICIIYILLIIILYCKTSEFKYILNIVKRKKN